MSMLFTKRVTGWKTETVPGTLESLTAAEAVTNVFDTKLQDDTKLGEREPQGGLSQITGYTQAVSGSASFSTEMHGNGTSGTPPWVALMLACGCINTSGVITPSAGVINPVSIGYWQTTRYRTLAGAMGNLVVKGMAGEKAKMNWSFKGLYAWKNTDTTIITPTYLTTVPPSCVSATFTLGGTTYDLPEWEWDLGNNVILIQDANGAGGYRYAWITGRKPTLKIPTSALAVSVQDWNNAYHTNAEMAVSLVVGSVANNIMTLTAPKLQLSQAPADENKDGQLYDDLVFKMNRSGSTQDSEWTLTLT